MRVYAGELPKIVWCMGYLSWGARTMRLGEHAVTWLLDLPWRGNRQWMAGMLGLRVNRLGCRLKWVSAGSRRGAETLLSGCLLKLQSRNNARLEANGGQQVVGIRA